MGDEPLTVLYIDDSDLQLDSVAGKLRSCGYRVCTASNVNDALRQVRGADLVMIDFHMPDMQGTEVLRTLREAAEDPERVVAYYLYTSDRDVAITYRELGFDGAFIGKGDVHELPAQLTNASRMLKLRRYRHARVRPTGAGV